MLVEQTRGRDQGAGVLKYMLIVTVVALVIYYFFSASRPTDVRGSVWEITTDLEQSICDVLPGMDCGATVPWERRDPERIEWDQTVDETCVLRLCW